MKKSNVLYMATAGAALWSSVGALPAAAAISSNQFMEVVARNSGKCVDVDSASTANGATVQQYRCNGSGAQQWQFVPTSNGYVKIVTRNDTSKGWDIADRSTTNGAKLQLYTINDDGGANQQWLPVPEATGVYHFVNRLSGKCLDVPSASLYDSVQLQQYDCNGSAAQSFAVHSPDGIRLSADNPDLGPNVRLFTPGMSDSQIQSQLDQVFDQQETNQFGNERYALLFAPGEYNVDVNLGFFTQVLGMGLSPDDVVIDGSVHVEADWWYDGSQNGTQNFWRGAENLSVNPATGTDTWAVSQAVPYRRMHERGNLRLDDGGYTSGGWISDTRVNGQIRSGTQQQFFSRNTDMGSWSGSNWNMVFVGDTGEPGQSYPNPPYTTIQSTPVVRDKPFLYVAQDGRYKVFVPALRRNSQGTSWGHDDPTGTRLDIDQFYVVKPGASAADMNQALASGKNLLVTPGVYDLYQTLQINRANTVVLGLGLATFVPKNGLTAIKVADVDGVKVAGLLIDADTTESDLLMQVGPSGANADHSANPTSLNDLFFRIGGNHVGNAKHSLDINSHDVIGDHMWLWRADHAAPGVSTGWYTNTAARGLTVNGDDVTMYGLFVEHYQRFQSMWLGENGRTYFVQSEMPYDVPNTDVWQHNGTRGFASYKVVNAVANHQAWGLGSYCFFSTNNSVVAEHGFEVPDNPGVQLHDMVTISLGGTGTINHVINYSGARVGPGNIRATVTRYGQ